MKSTDTFKEISQLHTKYQDRALAIDEEIEALKREKSELATASDGVYAIYRTAVIKETDADIDVLHGFIKASAAELDDTRTTEFRDSRPVPALKGYERDGGIPVSRCVDSMLWTLFAMKIREETGPSLKARVEKMMTEHVTKNAFIVEKAIDQYEYSCKVVWEMCEPASDFETVVAKAVGIVSEGAYSDEEAATDTKAEILKLEERVSFFERLAARNRGRLAELYYLTGEHRAAGRLQDSAYLLKGKDQPDAGHLLLMGCQYEKQGNYASAVKCYARVLTLKVDDKDVWYYIHNNLAYCLLKADNLLFAERYCRSAIGINPVMHKAH